MIDFGLSITPVSLSLFKAASVSSRSKLESRVYYFINPNRTVFLVKANPDQVKTINKIQRFLLIFFLQTVSHFKQILLLKC